MGHDDRDIKDIFFSSKAMCMLAPLQWTNRHHSVLPFLVCANIDDELHVHNAIAEA